MLPKRFALRSRTERISNLTVHGIVIAGGLSGMLMFAVK